MPGTPPDAVKVSKKGGVVIIFSLLERFLPHHPDSEKFRGSSSQSHCSPQSPQETLGFIETKNPTPQQY